MAAMAAIATGAAIALAACGGDDARALPPPATFGDASTDTGTKSKPDARADGLLADASDASDESGGLGCAPDKNCVGATMPTWQLQDFQPKSPRYGHTYGLEAFKGKVTVVALLSGW